MLRNRLLEEGVAPRHVVRIISELADHHEDLELEGERQGLDADTANAQASKRLGTQSHIAAHVLCRVELKSWCFRYPRLARLAMPIAYVAMLPLVPVFAGITNASAIVRWCACLMLSALVTAAMLLVMQISIGMP